LYRPVAADGPFGNDEQLLDAGSYENVLFKLVDVGGLLTAAGFLSAV